MLPWPETRHIPFAALAIAGLLVAAGLSSTRADEDIDSRLRSVEQALERQREREAVLRDEAIRIEQQIDELRGQLVAAAAAAQAREQAVFTLERRLEALGAEEREKSEVLARRRGELLSMIAALQTLSRRPAEALIVLPDSLTEASRTQLLLAAVVPELDRRARLLKGELADLARLREELSRGRAALAAEAAALEEDRERLAGLIGRKAALFARTEAERQEAQAKMESLVAQAADLRELLRRVEAQRLAQEPEVLAHVEAVFRSGEEEEEASAREGERQEAALSTRIVRPAPVRPFSEARGHVLLPVRGSLVTGFEQRNAAGLVSKGLVIETRPDALVVAPFDGVVVFAGPFRRYGQLLIIEHGEGYHTLLAGLGRIDCKVGQWLLAGEPVGVMSSDPEQRPKLYVELRRQGEPLDPLLWLSGSDNMVSG